MQAPLSNTASVQELRTGQPLGLPLSTFPLRPHGSWKGEDEKLRASVAGRRMPAGVARNDLRVAEGAGLAHDAGNLLGALRLYCDLLARPGVLSDEHRHYAEELQLLSQRSGALVDRLLNPAAMGSRCLKGEAPANTPYVSVPGVIEQCRGLLSTIARRAVDVVYDADSEMSVPVSPEVIERILVNLTKNAAEASTAGGAITLRVSRLRAAPDGKRRGSMSSRILLSIEDQGCGMSVAGVKVLLDAHGADSTVQIKEQPQRLQGLGLVSGREAGRGLGLKVVRELVQASGGELRLKSRSGCGTTIEIIWSVVREEAVRGL